MGWLDRFRRRGDDVPAGGRPSGQATGELREFLSSRDGIEAFVEPQTSVYAMTLLLVAGDGEHVRRPIKSPKVAQKLCDDAGVPLYDARKVGYPKRMKDYQKGIRGQSVSLEDLPPLDTTDEPER